MSMLPKKAQVLEIKQGDTLALGCSAKGADDVAIDLTGVTIRAQVRSSADDLIAELVVAPVNLALGTYELLWPEDGRVDAPVGDYVADIEYSVDGSPRDVVRSSRTFYLRVLKGVTA